MECPNCKKSFTNNFDKFSIEASGRCVDCQKVWSAKPENDPDLKKFEIEFSYTEDGFATIYAKTREDAMEQFHSQYGDDNDIDSIEEVKKKS